MNKQICTGSIYSLISSKVENYFHFTFLLIDVLVEKCQLCHSKTVYKSSPYSVSGLDCAEWRISFEIARNFIFIFCEHTISSFLIHFLWTYYFNFPLQLYEGDQTLSPKWIRRKLLIFLKPIIQPTIKMWKSWLRSILPLISISFPLDTSPFSHMVYSLNHFSRNWHIGVSDLLSIMFDLYFIQK